MRHSVFSLSPVLLALFACSGVVNAANNAQVNITANVTSSTCDLTVSSPDVDLGNFAPKAFTAAGDAVTGSSKSFVVGLSNCDGLTKKDDKGSLLITGDSQPGNPTIFVGPNPDNKNTGFLINAEGSSYLKSGDKVDVTSASEDGVSFDGKQVKFTASLTSLAVGDAVSTGQIKAPILFSYTYN